MGDTYGKLRAVRTTFEQLRRQEPDIACEHKMLSLASCARLQEREHNSSYWAEQSVLHDRRLTCLDNRKLDVGEGLCGYGSECFPAKGCQLADQA